MSVEFAYLQLHTQFSPFGGLATPAELIEQLECFAEGGKGLAVALTDTFSLAAAPQWGKLAQEVGLTPLYGAEIGLSLNSGTLSALPSSLILLVENQTGYHNLCRLIGAGLSNAGRATLTALVDVETLLTYHEGLIAIAPYYGGPVMAGLRLKVTEGKQRAQVLRDIFGSNNFFLGLPPPAGQPKSPTTAEPTGSRLTGIPKLNVGLVKLARELKLELVITGEAHYTLATAAANYAALRNRLGRALTDQYTLAQLQQPHDWLYAVRAERPTAELHLHSPEMLRTYYNEKRWPGALANNRAIAARCSKWHFPTDEPMPLLRQHCETALTRHFASPDSGLPEEEQTRAWLESELAEIEELELAGSLLAAVKAVAAGREFCQLVFVRQWSGSLVSYLLGLSEYLPKVGFRFAFEEGSRPLRLDVGRQGQKRLLAALNPKVSAVETWKAAPLAYPAAEPSAPALCHPRQILLSILETPLGKLTPLQPAVETRNGTQLKTGAQSGPVLPPGLYRLEIAESSGVARLQLALDILNQWRKRERYAPLELGELPPPLEGNAAEPDRFERELVKTRLEWFKQNWSVAYYAALLSLAEPSQRAGLMEVVRQAGLKLWHPTLQSAEAHFTMVDETTMGSGLGTVLGWEKAEELLAAHPFASLDEISQACTLTKVEWERLAWSGLLDHFGARESLAELAGELVRRGETWREWQNRLARSETAQIYPQKVTTEGQMSLFELLDPVKALEEALEAPEVKPLELPEVKPLSRLQRLRQQFEVLGFYTTEHPLWSRLIPDRTDPARSDPLTLSESLAKAQENGDGQPLVLVGMVTGLRRLPFTEKEGRGQELTVVRLEDWTERVEVLVPPDLQLSLVLEEGLALTVQARWLKPDPAQTSRPVLVAEDIDSYPPSRQFTAGEEDPEFVVIPEEEVSTLSGSSLSEMPSGDEGWTNSFFAEYGAAPATPANNPPPTPTEEPPPKSRNGKSRVRSTDRQTRQPLPRNVIIHINMSGDEAEDNEVYNRLHEVLSQHPGEDNVHVYLYWSDGETLHMEPQNLKVNYTSEFAALVTQLFGGGADTVWAEERSL